MFVSHNIYTKLSYLLVTFSSVIGFFYIDGVYSQLNYEPSALTYALIVVLNIMLILNSYFAYLIYQRRIKALEWCSWLYALQILALDTDSWDFSLSFGFKFNLSWSYEATNITVNIFALITLFILIKAQRSVSIANKKIKRDC